MHEVFLIVPMGVDGHAGVGHVRKLDLEDLRFFLGRDDINHRNVRNGRPMRQLPCLALSVLQPIRRLEGGAHFGVLPESGTQQEFLERRLGRNSKELQPLEWRLEDSQNANIYFPQKNLLVPNPHVQPIG